MNRHQLALLCLMLTTLLFGADVKAQMNVVSFDQSENNILANIAGTQVIAPQDARPAALIKVITTEKGFNFDGGVYSIVGDVKYYPSEIWVYVPTGAQKLIISHERFGRLSYDFPIPIESGMTYEMILDPGQGKYVTIQTEVPHSTVFIDGDSVGISPIKNEYLLYGPHKIFAKKGRNEGSLSIRVNRDGDNSLLNYTVPMEDQSIHFGKVTITTDPSADIYMNDKLLGVGKWVGELYEGAYEVETRKINCDPMRTRFVVLAQQSNDIEATAPIRHKGYLSLYTRPGSPKITIDERDTVLVETYELPVGNHRINLSNKGYNDFPKEYMIKHNVTLYDTITMQHLQYVTPNAFYFGGAFTIAPLSGATGIIGGRFMNIDLQLSYMFGLTKSNAVNYYSQETGRHLGTAEYSLNVISAKLGYQIAFTPMFGLTPQVGFAAHMLSGNTTKGTVPSQDTSAACATVGARFVYAPLRNLAVFAAPEYDIAVSKGRQYTEIADVAGFSAGGFLCNIGLLINF